MAYSPLARKAITNHFENANVFYDPYEMAETKKIIAQMDALCKKINAVKEKVAPMLIFNLENSQKDKKQ